MKENSRQQHSTAGAGLLLSAFSGVGSGNSKERAEQKPETHVTKRVKGLKVLDKGVVDKESTRGCWSDDTIKRHPDFVLGQ